MYMDTLHCEDACYTTELVPFRPTFAAAGPDLGASLLVRTAVIGTWTGAGWVRSAQ